MLTLAEDAPVVVQNMFDNMDHWPTWWEYVAEVQYIIGFAMACVLLMAVARFSQLTLRNGDLVHSRIDAMRRPRTMIRLGFTSIFLAAFVSLTDAYWGFRSIISAGGDAKLVEFAGAISHAISLLIPGVCLGFAGLLGSWVFESLIDRKLLRLADLKSQI